MSAKAYQPKLDLAIAFPVINPIFRLYAMYGNALENLYLVVTFPKCILNTCKYHIVHPRRPDIECLGD